MGRDYGAGWKSPLTNICRIISNAEAADVDRLRIIVIKFKLVVVVTK